MCLNPDTDVCISYSDSLSAHTTFSPFLLHGSLFSVLLHTLMWRGQAEAPPSSQGEAKSRIFSVRNIWESALSRAYLAGGWYWHWQLSYRGPFISVWTCGLSPNPGRSRRAHRQHRIWGVVAPRRNPALLLSSGAPPSILSSLPVTGFLCKIPSPPNKLSNPEPLSASHSRDYLI